MDYDSITERLKKIKLISTFNKPKGCSKSDIDKLESYFAVSLPKEYVKFLERFGHKAGKLFVGSDVFYQQLFELRGWAEELVSEDGGKSLPENSFVFYMHQGYEFLFFLLDEGDDPPIYLYVEGDKKFENAWPSFTSFLLSSIKEHEKKST